jgi:hypothetical protein
MLEMGMISEKNRKGIPYVLRTYFSNTAIFSEGRRWHLKTLFTGNINTLYL